MRLFWGIELPAAIVASLCEAQVAIAAACPGERVSWVAPEAMHITFKFLGDATAAAPIVEAVRAALPPTGPLELEVGGLGTFGGRRPRVVWAGVHGPGAEALAALAVAVDRALRPQGFRPETRRYTPHVTLGRVRPGRKGGRPQSALPAAVRALTLPAQPLVLTALVLFESSFGQGSGPPVYTPLERVELTTDSPGPPRSR